MKLCALLISALAACAQTYEVRGTVTEQDAGGISDVQVTILRMEDGAEKITKTDGQGAFRIVVDAPGVYVANVVKEGFFSILQGPSIVTVSAVQPAAVAHVSLLRAGEISGRVLDEDTREPVAGVSVSLFTRQWNYGQLTLQPGANKLAVTDEEGRFHFAGLRPAEYLATARAQALGPVRVLQSPPPSDREKVDEGYPPAFWPGGADASAAFATVLTSGGYAEVGTMFVRKVPQYRVQAKLQGSCPEGETVRLSLLRRNGGAASSLGSFPCNAEPLLAGFDPGTYALYAFSDKRGGDLATTVSGLASFEVTDRNLSVTIPLQPNVVIDGELSTEEGVVAPAVQRSIALLGMTGRPIDMLPGAYVQNELLLRWAPDQRHFQLALPPRPHTFNFTDASAGAYAREIRYNGTPVRGAVIPVNSGATAHSLEIILDDKFGSIAGSVTDGSRPAPGVQVLIVKDGVPIDAWDPRMPRSLTAGADGSFPATRLAPGDYRIFAFPPAQQSKMHEAGPLTRLLSAAQRVTIPAGGTQTVTIRLSDVR